MDGGTLKILIKGSRNYLRWTIEQWLYEVKDIVENEYGVRLTIEVVDGDEECPLVMYGGRIFFEGLPGEEGYLIEILKRIVEEALEANP